jgi:hypothetical protein
MTLRMTPKSRGICFLLLLKRGLAGRSAPCPSPCAHRSLCAIVSPGMFASVSVMEEASRVAQTKLLLTVSCPRMIRAILQRMGMGEAFAGLFSGRPAHSVGPVFATTTRMGLLDGSGRQNRLPVAAACCCRKGASNFHTQTSLDRRPLCHYGLFTVLVRQSWNVQYMLFSRLALRLTSPCACAKARG